MYFPALTPSNCSSSDCSTYYFAARKCQHEPTFKTEEAIGGRLSRQNRLQDATLGGLGHEAGTHLAWEVDLNGLDANVLGTRSHVESYGTGMRTWKGISKG